MKPVLLLSITFVVSSSLWAQTPSVKWTVSQDAVSGWIDLNGTLYPYKADSTNFELYEGMSTTPKFQTSYPNGFHFSYQEGHVRAIPDISGDGKEDIMLIGNDVNSCILIDGSTGAIDYYLTQVGDLYDSYQLFVGDVDGDGKNEIVTYDESKGSPFPWMVYSTNGIATGVSEKVQSVPQNLQLGQNYPNPFNPSTTIDYSLPSNARVVLKLYDVLGREVKTVVDERQSAGNHSVSLNASGLASGVYFYQLQAGNKVQAKKLMVVK